MIYKARTLRGDRSAIAVADMQQFRMNDDTASILESMYATSGDKQLEGAGKDAFAAMKMIETMSRGQYTPANGAQYDQAGELGRSLQQVARLIKTDAGVEAPLECPPRYGLRGADRRIELETGTEIDGRTDPSIEQKINRRIHRC